MRVFRILLDAYPKYFIAIDQGRGEEVARAFEREAEKLEACAD